MNYTLYRCSPFHFEGRQICYMTCCLFCVIIPNSRKNFPSAVLPTVNIFSLVPLEGDRWKFLVLHPVLSVSVGR